MALRLVSDIVRSRHHIPAAMLGKILLQSDPVLTWGAGVLRVEGFSSCCGMYVRADVEQRALDASELRPGTTNVDFNDGMRAALSRVRDPDGLDLAVGEDAVEVRRDGGGAVDQVVERKVELPVRWLRGFLEVPTILSRMEPRFTVERAAAIRFVRSLPSAGRSSDAVWVVPAGRSLRLSSRSRADAVRLAGVSRIRALEPALPLVRRLVVHGDPHTGASAWRLDGGDVSVTAAVSPETWRGFSGEGQLLSTLAVSEPRIARVRALLSWQSSLTMEELVQGAGGHRRSTEGALAWLASRGLVGYDLARGEWFHRVLPYDLDAAQQKLVAQQPRLTAARALVEAGAVETTRTGDGVRAMVRSRDVCHRVRLGAEGARCTCTWFSRHGIERGPCKHILAVELHGSEEVDE